MHGTTCFAGTLSKSPVLFRIFGEGRGEADILTAKTPTGRGTRFATICQANRNRSVYQFASPPKPGTSAHNRAQWRTNYTLDTRTYILYSRVMIGAHASRLLPPRSSPRSGLPLLITSSAFLSTPLTGARCLIDSSPEIDLFDPRGTAYICLIAPLYSLHIRHLVAGKAIRSSFEPGQGIECPAGIQPAGSTPPGPLSNFPILASYGIIGGSKRRWERVSPSGCQRARESVSRVGVAGPKSSRSCKPKSRAKCLTSLVGAFRESRGDGAVLRYQRRGYASIRLSARYLGSRVVPREPGSRLCLRRELIC